MIMIIGHCWDDMYNRIRPRPTTPRTAQELTDDLIRNEHELPKGTVIVLIRDIPDFCWECIRLCVSLLC